MSDDRFTKWYEKNRERVSERRRRKYATDPEYRQEAKERSRAYKRANPGEARWLKSPPPKPDVRRRMLPRVFIVGNQQVRCVTTRATAAVVGVRATTMAGWERRGVLPGPTVLDKCGHRWYSEEYVASLAKVVRAARRGGWSADKFAEEVKKGVSGGSGMRGDGSSGGVGS